MLAKVHAVVLWQHQHHLGLGEDFKTYIWSFQEECLPRSWCKSFGFRKSDILIQFKIHIYSLNKPFSISLTRFFSIVLSRKSHSTSQLSNECQLSAIVQWTDQLLVQFSVWWSKQERFNSECWFMYLWQTFILNMWCVLICFVNTGSQFCFRVFFFYGYDIVLSR